LVKSPSKSFGQKPQQELWSKVAAGALVKSRSKELWSKATGAFFKSSKSFPQKQQEQ